MDYGMVLIGHLYSGAEFTVWHRLLKKLLVLIKKAKVPWTVWKQFGDVDIVRENWDAMNRYMSHVNETQYDHDRLTAENRNYQWADWLSYEPLESCSGKAWDKGGLLPDAKAYWNFLSASYWAIDARMMGDMAAAIGPLRSDLDDRRSVCSCSR